jgi:hypothetical protein
MEAAWRKLNGFWQEEERLLGPEELEEDTTTLEAVFDSIAQGGTPQAR